MSKGFDTTVQLTATQATGLVKAGFTHVGRYLDNNWKAITKQEADLLKASGLQIISIFESNPTSVSYFTVVKGKVDAVQAIGFAKVIGQPLNTAIYFTVDYDAQPSDYNEILAYFQSVKANLGSYKLGIYGSYDVLNFLHSKDIGDYYMQTLAWSHGKKCTFLNIYQNACDQKLNGISVDTDDVLTSDVGSWGNAPIKLDTVAPAKPIVKQIGTIIAKVHTVIRKGANASYDIVKTIDPKDGAFKCYGSNGKWLNVGIGWVHSDYVTFTAIK